MRGVADATMVSEEVVKAGRIWLSAISAKPDRAPARANIIALPGGGHTCRYWHHPRKQDASLLHLGALLGYRVVAFDRPGYGTSTDAKGSGFSHDQQIELLAEAITKVCHASEADQLFLVGHSMGGILSMKLAASGVLADLQGIDVSGVPYRFSDVLLTAMAEATPTNASRSARALFYGPEGSFDPSIFEADNQVTAPVPPSELEDSSFWPTQFSAITRRVTVPVQYTLADHDRTTPCDDTTLEAIRNNFSASPRVETRRQLASGHNISFHHIARSYHLRAIAFFDEVLALQGR